MAEALVCFHLKDRTKAYCTSTLFERPSVMHSTIRKQSIMFMLGATEAYKLQSALGSRIKGMKGAF